MCGCSGHGTAGAAFAPDHVIRVADMACGHCASTIEGAITRAFSGVSVQANPATKEVALRGAIDVAAIEATIKAAGYTPTA